MKFVKINKKLKLINQIGYVNWEQNSMVHLRPHVNTYKYKTIYIYMLSKNARNRPTRVGIAQFKKKKNGS